MVSVKEIEEALYRLAPRELAMSWDNVGLLVGNRTAKVQRVLVALDITPAVLHEAIGKEVQLIASHHPVMNCHWNPVQNLLEDCTQGRILRGLIEHHISAICMHTNLDAAQGGVNDCLAEALGLRQVETFNPERIGRIGILPHPCTLPEFLELVKQALHCQGLRYRNYAGLVEKVAVCGGSSGEYISQAKELGCDAFVGADFSYHQFLDNMQIHLVDAGHFPTEDVVCQALLRYLNREFPSLTVQKSEWHEDVIQYYC